MGTLRMSLSVVDDTSIGIAEVPEIGSLVNVRGAGWSVTDVTAQSLPPSSADDGRAELQHAVTMMLRQKLTGARFWTYVHPDGGYSAQHSKVVIVDSRSAFVTSANLSIAGAERNLEAGVIVHHAASASGMRQRFTKLWEHGAITNLG
jgi:hypothetical protein